MVNSFNDFLEETNTAGIQRAFGDLVDFYREKNSKIIQGIVLLQGLLDETIKIEKEAGLDKEGMMTSRDIILDLRNKNDTYIKMERLSYRLGDLLREYNREVNEALEFFS